MQRAANQQSAPLPLHASRKNENIYEQEPVEQKRKAEELQRRRASAESGGSVRSSDGEVRLGTHFYLLNFLSHFLTENYHIKARKI